MEKWKFEEATMILLNACIINDVSVKTEFYKDLPEEIEKIIRMKTYNHAKKELEILEKVSKDNLVNPFKNEILSLCRAFGESGQ